MTPLPSDDIMKGSSRPPNAGRFLCEPPPLTADTDNYRKGDTVITTDGLRVGQVVSPVIEKFEVLAVEPDGDSYKVTVRYADDSKEATLLLGADIEFFVLSEDDPLSEDDFSIETEDDIENEFRDEDDYLTNSKPSYEFDGKTITYYS